MSPPLFWPKNTDFVIFMPLLLELAYYSLNQLDFVTGCTRRNNGEFLARLKLWKTQIWKAPSEVAVIRKVLAVLKMTRGDVKPIFKKSSCKRIKELVLLMLSILIWRAKMKRNTVTSLVSRHSSVVSTWITCYRCY